MIEFSDLKVLVVEDEGVVALMIEDMLEDLGCSIAASVARLPEACAAAAGSEFDLAVLDVNLAGQPSFPVAEILRERGIPFMFSTGYGKGSLPEEYAGCPVVGKPFSVEDLKQEMTVAIGSRGSLRRTRGTDQLASMLRKG
ncbi:response regulator [Rhizobium aegyptiacum]|uniref:response regulator n=1 Tax=Rhizobium aegyptiacum TaxID=1764550 RepID=UPI0007E543B5|nr:response regulator [Rhizobium aegyptiacum]